MTTATKHAILLVDDEPEILFSLRGLLRRDFELHTANSGADATARAHRGNHSGAHDHNGHRYDHAHGHRHLDAGAAHQHANSNADSAAGARRSAVGCC